MNRKKQSLRSLYKVRNGNNQYAFLELRYENVVRYALYVEGTVGCELVLLNEDRAWSENCARMAIHGGLSSFHAKDWAEDCLHNRKLEKIS